MQECVFMRQPVLTEDGDTIAYQLALADETSQTFDLLSIDLELLSANLPILLPLSEKLLESLPQLPLNQDSIIVNLQAQTNEPMQQSVLDNGFKTSMTLNDISTCPDRLKKNAYLVIDVTQYPPEQIQAFMQDFTGYQGKIIAGNIQTHEAYEAARNNGFNYFLGDYFLKAKVCTQDRVEANQLVTLKLLSTLQDPDCSLEEVENLVSSDPAVVFKLLRIINSAAYSFQREITSVGEVIVMLGLKQLRNIVSFIALSACPKPLALMTTALVRAKMCEGVAQCLQLADTGPYFTVGLFSLLDTLLDQPMDRILDQISIADEIKQAILEHEGTMGEILKNTIRYENLIIDGLNTFEDKVNYHDIYLDALTAAENITQHVKS